MLSGNPALNANTFLDASTGRVVSAGDNAMTINGTVNKTGLLLFLVLLTAGYTWSLYIGHESVGAIMPMVLVGAIGGFIVALVTVFKKTWAPITATLYADRKSTRLNSSK